MDPLKEIGRKQKAMDKGAYRDALNRPVDAIQQSTPYRLADLIMNGEDADIGMAESLIPTVSLQKKLAQGKLPGLADIMDIPNPLSAMAPIGYGLKELRAGARLGKSKSPTLSRLRDLDINFRTKPGAIGRGNVEFHTGGTPLINPFKHLRDVSTPK